MDQPYTGKNPVRGYARHFPVDLICTITEMRMLGYPVTEEYELVVKRLLSLIPLITCTTIRNPTI